MPRASIKSYRASGSQAANRRKLYANYAATKSLRRAGYSTVPRTMGVYAAGEMKYFDTERSATAIPANGTYVGTSFPPNVSTPTTLCCPVTGSGISQRIGRKVNVHRIVVKGIIQIVQQTGQAAGDAASTIRLALVQDTQTNATQAAGSDIFQVPTTVSAVNAVCSFQSLQNLGRFRVLRDKTINMQNPNMANDTQAAGGIVQQGLQRKFKLTYKPNKPIQVSFNAVNGGTISDIVDNSWCVYALSTSTSLAPTITYQARVYYKE